MRPHELGEWLAFYRVSPWGDFRADQRAGIVASTIANCSRDPKKRGTPYRPDEFMPYQERPPRMRADRKELERRLLSALGVAPDPKKVKRKR